MSRFGTGEAPLSTALVALTPNDREPAPVPTTSRPHADFIAHLIATSAQAPQTCARRRAAPEAVTQIYRACGQLPGKMPARAGRALSRSL
jgi:hypothetical protein